MRVACRVTRRIWKEKLDGRSDVTIFQLKTFLKVLGLDPHRGWEEIVKIKSLDRIIESL